MDGLEVARNFGPVGADDLGEPPAEGDAIADPVDEAGAPRRLGHVAAGRLHELVGILRPGGDLRARPGLAHVLLPRLP